jgi:hypothetical protein
MSIEREIVISILKLTKEGPVSHELVKKDAKTPADIVDKLLETLQNDGLAYCRLGMINVDSLQRVKLALRAIQIGADLERVSSLLSWQEFEKIAAIGFEQNNYQVIRNMRFKQDDRKWEIDIVGYKKPIVVCGDCKHWHHGMHPSTLKRIVHEQTMRTNALFNALPKLSGKITFAEWENPKFVPAVLSLVAAGSKFYDKVPVVPVLQLQDFLSQLPAYIDSLAVCSS